MKKKVIAIFIILIIFIGLGVFYLSSNKETKDGVKFKNEYESLNNKTNSKGVKYRNIKISENNPFVYATASEIVNKIENKETFFVYFGDSMCPWCRSAIEKAIEVAKDYEIKTIYYVKIWDDDHNEVLRDTYAVEASKIVEKSKGTDSYYKLLSYFDNVLSNYTVTNDAGNKITLDEKRIYAPNYIFVNKGQAELLINGYSSLQKDSNEELTEEMLKDEQEQFEKLFEAGSVCEDNQGC